MIYIWLILFIGTSLSGKKLYKTYVNPCTLFLGIFEFAIFILYATDFFNINLISDKMWAIYILSFVAFILGITINRCSHFTIKKNNIKCKSKIEQRYYLKEIWIIFIIALFATGIYWIQTIRIYGINGILKSLMTSYEVSNLNGIPVVVLYAKMLTLFLSPYVLNYIITYKERKLIYYCMIVFTFVANIAYTRDTLFYLVVLDGLVYAYTHIKRNSKVSFKWVGYLIAGIFALKFFSYTQSLLNKQFEVSGHFLGVAMNSAFITIVSYFAGPIVSAGVYLKTLTNVPVGGYILRNFFSLINTFGIWKIDTDTYMPTDWVYIPFQFNTTSIQLYIYKEGGWLWIIFFFLLVGFIIDRAFINYIKKHSRYTLMLLIFLSLIMVMSIRSDMLTRLDMFIYILTLILLKVSRKFVIKKRTVY